MLVNGAKKRDDDLLLLDVLGEADGKYYTYVSTFMRFVWNVRATRVEDGEGRFKHCKELNYGFRYLEDDSPSARRSSCTSREEAIMRHQVSSARPLYEKVDNVLGRDFYGLEHLMKCFKEVAA